MSGPFSSQFACNACVSMTANNGLISAAAQQALLLHLAASAEQGHADTVELWRATKETRELRCVARHLPTGVDLQVFERDEFKHSQLCATAPDARVMAETWRKALQASGWAITGSTP
jgi:hypothetical protein